MGRTGAVAAKTTDTKKPDFRLRVVVRRFPGDNAARTSEPITATSLEEALPQLAQDVTAETEPYILGVYIFNEEGPKATVSRILGEETELEPRKTLSLFSPGVLYWDCRANSPMPTPYTRKSQS